MWGRKQMSEMSYQLSQLTALNNRLQSDEAMYKMICESSADAFVYFDYAQKSIVHLGNWSHFFDFELNYNSLSHILSFVEDEYQTDLYDCLTLEHNYLTNCSVEFKRKDRYNRSEADRADKSEKSHRPEGVGIFFRGSAQQKPGNYDGKDYIRGRHAHVQYFQKGVNKNIFHCFTPPCGNL